MNAFYVVSPTLKSPYQKKCLYKEVPAEKATSWMKLSGTFWKRYLRKQVQHQIESLAEK